MRLRGRWLRGEAVGQSSQHHVASRSGDEWPS
jgi:hypothetical protein